MTTKDPKYRITAIVCTVVLFSVMAVYESRKKESIADQLNAEKVKVEQILSGKVHLEKELEKTKQQLETLELKHEKLKQSGDH